MSTLDQQLIAYRYVILLFLLRYCYRWGPDSSSMNV